VATFFGGLSLSLLQSGQFLGPAEVAEQLEAAWSAGAEPSWNLAANVALYVSLTLQFAAISAAFLAAQLLRGRRLFDVWNKERGEAELYRRTLFETVTRSDEPLRPGEIALLPLQLEYFRRFQLDVQSAYYRRRGDQHWEASNGSKGLGGQVWRAANWPGTPLAVFVIAMVILLAPGQSALVSGLLTGLSLLGVLGTGLTSYFNGVSALDQDRLNAARYFIAAKNLNFLYESRLPAARKLAAAGDKEAVAKFVDDVNAQISTEHREWFLLHDPDSQPGLSVARPSL
jgi:hypothetical protein